MKGIKRTLVASLFASSALQAQAVDNPWGGGVKAGYLLNSSRVGDKKNVQIQGGDTEIALSHWGNGEFYGKYTFSQYFDAQLALAYLRQDAVLKKKGEDKVAVAIQSHGIVVPLSCYIYPFGREEGEGAFLLHLGGNLFFPLSTKLRKDGQDIEQETLTDNQKKEMPGWDGGPHWGIGWEFASGLTIETRGFMHFKNRFSLPDGQDQQTIFNNASSLKAVKGHEFTLNVGYNLASLFTE